MKVFKFGGASVNSVDRIKNIAEILKLYSSESLVIIISAMGKTTNALEKVAENFFEGNTEKALQLFEEVKQQQLALAQRLLQNNFTLCYDALAGFVN